MATNQSKKESTDAKLKITWHAIDRMYNKIAIKNGSTFIRVGSAIFNSNTT